MNKNDNQLYIAPEMIVFTVKINKTILDGSPKSGGSERTEEDELPDTPNS